MNRIKMTLALSIMLLIIAISLPAVVHAVAAGDTFTDVFPDVNFRSAVLSLLNADGGGRTSASIVSDADKSWMAVRDGLNIDNRNIADLTGIEYFTGMTFLYCYDNPLGTLSLPKNTALQRLYTWNTGLTKLDMSANTALTRLECQMNQIESLNITKNVNLGYINCRANQMTTLDVSNNININYIVAHTNKLQSIDLSNNKALMHLELQNNQLTKLDVSANTALLALYCGNNQLTSLDVSKITALQNFSCNNNNMNSLNAVKGWHKLGLEINSPENLGAGAFHYYNQNVPQVITVVFLDWDDTELKMQVVEHGSAAIAPATPVRTGYTFTGWDKAFDNITSDLVVTAQYTLDQEQPIIVFSVDRLSEAAGRQLQISVTIPESMKNPGRSITAYFALYDKNGRLVSIATYSDVSKGNYTVNIPADTTGMKFKAFLWNDLFMPLTKAFTLN
jgi:hypothetical protein